MTLGASASEPPAAAAAPEPAIALPDSISKPGAPVVFERAAPDGRWIVLCEATLDSDGDGAVKSAISPFGVYSGDQLDRVLSFASGERVAIEDLLATSPDGAWLVVVRAGRGELWNARTQTQVDLSALGADLRRDPGQLERHRSLVFDDEHLFYVRSTQGNAAVVERTLRDGSERVLASAPTIVRIHVDAGGRAIVLEVPGRDANGNGRFDWPRRPTLERAACKSPLPRYLSPHIGADPIEHVLIDRKTGVARRVDNFAGLQGERLILRAPDGALLVSDGSRQSQLLDKACLGRVLFSDPFFDNLLLGCALPKKQTRFAVGLYRRGVHTALDIDVAALSQDEPAHAPARLWPLYPGADTVLFDAQAHTLHRLEPGDLVLSTAGAHALVRRGKSAWLFDAQAKSARELSAVLSQDGELLHNGPLCFASPFLFDVERGRVLGRVEGRPLALARSGALLFAQKPANAAELAEGPLTWQTVAPVEESAP